MWHFVGTVNIERGGGEWSRRVERTGGAANGVMGERMQ